MSANRTRDWDRGEKLNHHKQCPSLAAVLFLSHRRPQVTVILRTADGWEQREHRSGQHVELSDPQLRFSVDELYAGIRLEV